MRGYNKNLHNNKLIEINMSLYEKISKSEMAEILSIKKISRTYFILKMNRLKSIHSEVIKMLKNSSFHEIQLQSLGKVDNLTLNILAECNSALEIGLINLKKSQAKILSQNKSALVLSKLKKISDSTAKELSAYQGNILELPALNQLTPKAFSYLNEFKGDFLTIGSLIKNHFKP
jgi:hypothetical protein